MKILLLGKSGKVGWELQRSLSTLAQVVALGRERAGDLIGDLSRLRDLAETVRTVGPDVIVNAAAYTKVDQAEEEPELAYLVNAEAPRVLATEAKKIGASLVHYSTDYVFDGSGKHGWRESDPTGPLNVYGKSKLDGENAIRGSGCEHLIFRTSWVYASRRGSFLQTILRMATERDALQVVDDQFGAPTGAELVADVTAHALSWFRSDSELGGTYHLAASGETSWHGYALFLLQNARERGWPIQVQVPAVQPKSTERYDAPARRPHNSRLNCRHLEQTFGLQMPAWTDGVLRVLEEIAPPRSG